MKLGTRLKPSRAEYPYTLCFETAGRSRPTLVVFGLPRLTPVPLGSSRKRLSFILKL
jgi:hypothetical protein